MARTRRLLVRPFRVVRPVILVEVLGRPAPQGSMRLFRSRDGRTVAKYGPTVYEWRGLVTAAVREAWSGPMIEGPVAVSLDFELPRPAGHSGTGRNRGTLRPSAPVYPATAPDLDKLERAVLDAITDAGSVWRDDAQVVRLTGSKRYADGDSVPGVTIIVAACET